MLKSLLLVFLLFPIIVSGKETKKITLTHGFNGFTDLTGFKEIFYVLRSDTTVRQGTYRLESMGKVMITGHFKMGIRDSIWTQFNLKGKVRSRGWFEENKRDGLWEFYTNEGKLEQQIDFSKNDVIYYQTPLANHPFRVMSGADTLLSVLDRPPLFIGGFSRFNDYVADEIEIPLHKSGEKVSGIVYIGFTIDSIGKTSNHHVIRGIGKICNNEALRVMKCIPDDWMPGILNGKKVSIEYVIPFKFEENALDIKP